MDEALVDEDRGTDAIGHPKVVWNAVNGVYFIGVSAGLQDATYNCYPATPNTSHRPKLEERARRSVEEALTEKDGPHVSD